MDVNERLTALKKAYADIILNTAKEAAARILASERKALRFQQELYASKEEALQMMLRLKQMMDSKVNEATVRSMNDEKKIDVLEAQLQEAEDIVKDLRQELREVQAELERVKINSDHDLDEVRLSLQHEPVTDPATNIFNLKDNLNCFTQLNNAACITNPDLPSIILRKKEPELYRNGCTQRIRACERNTVDQELSPSNDVKHETSVKEGEDAETTSGKVCNIVKKGTENENNGLSSWYKIGPVKSIRRKRKRAFRFGRKRAPRFANHTIKSKGKTCQKTVDELDGQIPKLQNGPEESSVVTAGKMDCQRVDVALKNSEAEVFDINNGTPSQHVNDRVIKYTFQRKRKRKMEAPAENSNLSRNTGENQSGSLESPKLTLMPESSRDSRRLAQVARQLISLSEKKWW